MFVVLMGKMTQQTSMAMGMTQTHPPVEATRCPQTILLSPTRLLGSSDLEQGSQPMRGGMCTQSRTLSTVLMEHATMRCGFWCVGSFSLMPMHFAQRRLHGTHCAGLAIDGDVTNVCTCDLLQCGKSSYADTPSQALAGTQILFGTRCHMLHSLMKCCGG